MTWVEWAYQRIGFKLAEIAFRAAIGPTINGVANEAIVTQDEVQSIIAAIDIRPDISVDLEEHSILVNQWRADSSPVLETWLPQSISELNSIVAATTGRPETGLLGIYLAYEYMISKGWIKSE